MIDSYNHHKRALLVEPNEKDRNLIRHLLSSKGFDVDVESKSNTIFNPLSAESYDLLVLDSDLSSDDLRLLTKLKTTPPTTNVPIILLVSQEVNDKQVFRGQWNLPYDIRLVRPINRDEFSLTIKRIFEALE